mmetsp:Transcript_1067/g.1675  ORF Transcript_1067/g.1675 Transcript_1067/m.1675 type:complete len:211 (-) Transcript_1067:548-1180(-)
MVQSQCASLDGQSHQWLPLLIEICCTAAPQLCHHRYAGSLDGADFGFFPLVPCDFFVDLPSGFFLDFPLEFFFVLPSVFLDDLLVFVFFFPSSKFSENLPLSENLIIGVEGLRAQRVVVVASPPITANSFVRTELSSFFLTAVAGLLPSPPKALEGASPPAASKPALSSADSPDGTGGGGALGRGALGTNPCCSEDISRVEGFSAAITVT